MLGDRIVIATVAALGIAAPSLAQGSDSSAPTLEALQERIQKLEQRLADQSGHPAPPEAAKAPADDLPADGRPAPAPVSGQAAPPALLTLELGKSVQLNIGGRLRLRGELRDPATYAEPALSNDPHATQQFVLQRTRIHLEFDVLKHLRARVELQDSRVWGETGLATDTPDTHLFQGYVELYDLFEHPFTVRAGRFELPNLGEGRLISGLDWHNVARRTDGLMASYGTGESWVVHGLFWDLLDPPGLSDNDEQILAGLYATFKPVEKHQVDAYLFWRHLNGAGLSESGRTGDREDWTVGARVFGSLGTVFYGGEAVFQIGNEARDDVLSWAWLLQAGVNLKLADEMKLQLQTELAYARGDQDPTDGNAETFDPILPFGHKYHGHIDLMSWRNMYGYKLGAAFWPNAWLSVHADGHAFWLANKRDSWYGATKGPIRTDTSGTTGHYVGSELDLYLKATLLEQRVAIWAGYSHFFPGTYVRQTGRSFGMDWAFVQVEVFF